MKNALVHGLLVNPFDRTLTEISCRSDHFLDDLYKLLSTDSREVRCVDVVSLEAGADAWIDDEGLFVPSDSQAYFVWEGRFLAGKAAIFSSDDEGETINTKMTRQYVSELRLLGFPKHEEAAAHAQAILSRPPTIIPF